MKDRNEQGMQSAGENSGSKKRPVSFLPPETEIGKQTPVLRHRWVIALAAFAFTVLTFFLVPLSDALKPSPEPPEFEVEQVSWYDQHYPEEDKSVKSPQKQTASNKAQELDQPPDPPPVPQLSERELPDRELTQRVETPSLAMPQPQIATESTAFSVKRPEVASTQEQSVNAQASAVEKPDVPVERSSGKGKDTDRVFSADEVGKGIRVLDRVRPRYPSQARRRAVEGYVKLSFVVTKRGKVRDVEVVEASPEDTFDDSAVDALNEWEFQPALEEEKPVACRASVTIRFKLRD